VYGGPRVVDGRARMQDLSSEKVALRLLELYNAVLARWHDRARV